MKLLNWWMVLSGTLWNGYSTTKHDIALSESTETQVSISLENSGDSTRFSHSYRYPAVIWHGLGDNYNSSGIRHIEELVSQIHAEVPVYRIRVNDDPEKDQQSSLVGDLNVILQQVCDEIKTIPLLSNGFDAIGGSQGGLFVRALLQRCDVSIHNLISFGSPHMGVQDLPTCANPRDWLCKRRNQLLKKQVWFSSVQHSIVPAQYFRDPYDYENYLEHSNFLADLNNELGFNATYAEKIQGLNKLVMVKFADDTTVVPKTSAQFGDIDPETGNVVPLRESRLYKSDTLGLKKLDEKGGLVFHELEGDHMQIPESFLVDIISDYLGASH